MNNSIYSIFNPYVTDFLPLWLVHRRLLLNSPAFSLVKGDWMLCQYPEVPKFSREAKVLSKILAKTFRMTF